jgi:hypothetical protein
MKKISVILIVLVLLVVSTAPALAAGRPSTLGGRGAGISAGLGGNPPFALAGTIASLDAQAKTVTVTVVCGNTLVKPYIGQNLVIQTNNATRFLLRNPGGYATPITFNDLVIGQKVSANGQLANNVWTAGRITVGAELNCLP